MSINFMSNYGLKNLGLKKDSPQNYTTGCGFLTSVLIWCDTFGALVGSQAYYRFKV